MTRLHSPSDPTAWGDWQYDMATAELTRSSVGIHNLLIATDFSHQSDTALTFGLDFAQLYGAKAEIVYVMPTEEYVIAGSDGMLVAREAARRDLLELKSRLHKHPAFEESGDHEVSMLEGSVAECLLQCVRAKKVDIVVVGTHGRGGLGKIILGSVAEKVFRQSPAPVLTIGPKIHRPRRMSEVRHVLAPCDLSRKSHPAVQYACALAAARNSELTVLHVIEQFNQGNRGDLRHGEQEIIEYLRKIVGRDGERLDVHYRVEQGRIASTILKVASEPWSDLVVMGVRPSSGLLDRFMWPIAYELVREAACPVLTIRGGAPIQ